MRNSSFRVLLPPVARLSREQAMYHFISGYTAKVAGTERGVKEPSATFSACFGAPFMPLHPGVYAKLLSDKIAKTGAKVFMVNTGWTGGGYGVGTRMKIPHTRAMLNAAIDGALDHAEYVTHPVLGLAMPRNCPGVPAEVLDQRIGQRWHESGGDARAAECQRQRDAAVGVEVEIDRLGPDGRQDQHVARAQQNPE